MNVWEPPYKLMVPDYLESTFRSLIRLQIRGFKKRQNFYESKWEWVSLQIQEFLDFLDFNPF